MSSLLNKSLDIKSAYLQQLLDSGEQEIYLSKAVDFGMTLEEFHQRIKDCQKCALGKTRNKFVFGTGNSQAKLMLIGEAPGRDEDNQGKPFVGRAGQLLDKILNSVNFIREEVFITNILKCRPPNNRDPQPDEVEQCMPYLNKQIETIKPQIICCLGRVAAQFLLDTKESLAKLREKDYYYDGIKVFVTYHPAALLRNQQFKRPTWEDVKNLRRYYLKINNLPAEKLD